MKLSAADIFHHVAFVIYNQVPCLKASPTALYRLYIGIADGTSIARVWVCPSRSF